MIIIKKYSNRRLYDTSTSSYVNLSQIADRIRQGHRIKVVDAKEGGDLTQQVLLQVLLEHQGGLEMLPTGLLHRIIRATNDNPLQRMAVTQLAAGMHLLDQQLAGFERQAGWTVDEPAPPETPPEPAPRPSRAASRSTRAAPAPEPEASLDDTPADDGEMDDLRARLAALEERLAGR